VLVLDEPTAVLPHDEVERLFAVVREVRKAGTAILYVSHRMDEIFQLADRVTILRGGKLVSTVPIEEIDPRSLAGLMVGEDVDPDYRAPVADRPDAPVVLETRNVTGRWLRGVDLQVHRGEILGIAGLAGAGVLELPYVLSGHAPDKVSGEVRLGGEESWRDVKEAKDFNIPLVPSDRQREGVIAEFAVSENLSLSILGKLGRKGRLALRRERQVVEEWSRRLEIKTEGPNAPISTLSGGNQQKVVVARCLVSEPEILVLCEPTAGVDIGTRVAIYELIAKLSKEGLTVIVSSSDEGDLLAMCTRIVVLRNGRVAEELDGDGLSQQALVSAIEGEN
jgi:ABC-type sugar transport system ATPase subunit